MILRRVKKEMLIDQPYLIWNEYINLLAMESFEDLTETQKLAQLCFWYDSEVQNGGHLQYFENQGTRLIDRHHAPSFLCNDVSSISENFVLASPKFQQHATSFAIARHSIAKALCRI